ncbi:carbon-nitrogen family hydrolase [Bacillus solimangrovi]|uniref:Hydrolase n=1 Tax=Bacillus solimangrovi TaxID=1305675 RepID=A0A1E5LCD0_9BACI|nr:carbon-nitrogen family hydrolase [Bacillus solimangrovi]OEH91758.1 hydrolase [Bacillus solimangrovi]
MKWKITCIQMDIQFGQPDLNFEHAKSLLHKYATDSDVLVLPELWTTGYDLTRLDEIGDHEAQRFQSEMSETVAALQTHLVAGSTAAIRKNGITNSLYVYNKTGSKQLSYSKAHLFQLMNEHHYLISGEQDGLFMLDGTTCAGMICYDIRFPEWIRLHAVNGAKVIFVVAQWPLARVDHWRSLLIARAIENQCFVVACNRIGSDPDNTFAGHSMVINPWGDIIAEVDETSEALTAEIDLTEINNVRKTIPIFEDRRPSLYEKLENK